MSDTTPPQSGNNYYTKIPNGLLENLCKIRISGEARQMLDVIMRKTYGYNKEEDKISTSQFMEFTGLSKPAVHKARRKLIAMNLIRVYTKKDTVYQKGYSQVLTYCIQGNYNQWKVYTKKDTVYQKGYKLYTKKDTGCIPKSNTQKKLLQKKERNIIVPDAEHLELALLLKSLILKNNPKSFIKDSQIKSWADTIRLMVRKGSDVDNRTLKEIRELIIWSQNDPFWQKNILSMQNLRKQFDRLTMQKNKKVSTDLDFLEDDQND